jgi:hypothetical protein
MNGGSEQAAGFVRELSDAARRNPVSAALIGMGAVWLLASRTQRGSELMRRTGIDRLPEAAQEAWHGTSSSVREGLSSLRETTTDRSGSHNGRGDRMVEQMTAAGERLLQSASDHMDDLPAQAGNLLDDARDNMTELFKSHPIAIGAVGVAIGAAMAAALPTTAAEATYFGEGSEFVKQRASELVGQQVERATEIGVKVADAVADEARQQGLTADKLKSAASDLSGKAARVANAATEGSKD